MTGLIDANGAGPMWTPANGPCRAGQHEAERYSPDAVMTMNGVAIVVNRDPAVAGWFISGELDTGFVYGPGTYSARLRMPKTPAAGLWPAFWLVNNHATVPPQEIDVVEWLGAQPTKIRCNYIWGYDSPTKQTTSTIDVGVDLSADFHDYAITWNDRALTWWFDGRVVKTFTAADAQALGVTLPTALVRVIVGVTVGGVGALGGPTTVDTVLPATFNVASVTAT